jgi:hypothetical protein
LWSAWFRIGAAAEGDLEAEVTELADVVGDLAADGAADRLAVRGVARRSGCR